MNSAHTGRVESINVSNGGVPKWPVPTSQVTRLGLSDDAQRDTEHHGGPDRAVCLLALEVIQSLRKDGHPISPGAAGENLTISGIEWNDVVPGVRLRFEGGVQLEIVSYTQPCATIKDAFTGGAISLVNQEVNPGQSRVYARVLTEGTIVTGERLYLVPSNGATE
jgi:MOSC domain-containing protein YiiM